MPDRTEQLYSIGDMEALVILSTIRKIQTVINLSTGFSDRGQGPTPHGKQTVLRSDRNRFIMQ